MSQLIRQQIRERNAPQHALDRDVSAHLRCACCSHGHKSAAEGSSPAKICCGGAAGVTKRQKTDIALAAAVRSLLPASGSATTAAAAAGSATAAASKGQQAAVARAPPQRQQRDKQPLTPPQQQQQRPPQPTATGPRLLEPRQHGAPRAPQQFYAVSAPRLSSSLTSGLIPWCSCCEMPQKVCLWCGARRACSSGGFLQLSAGFPAVQRAVRNPVEVLQGGGAAPRQPHPQLLQRRRQEAEDEAELADFLDDGPGGGGGGDDDWRAELRSITGYDPSRWACINFLALKEIMVPSSSVCSCAPSSAMTPPGQVPLLCLLPGSRTL